MTDESKTQIPLEPTDQIDPASNGTGTLQQDNAQAKPVVVETPTPVEQPAESVPTETLVDTVPEIMPEPAPAPAAQEEISVVEPQVEESMPNHASPEERPPSAPLHEDSPPTPQPSAPAQAEQVQTLPQPQNKITPQGRTSPVTPPSSAPPRGTTFSRDFVQKLLIKARAKIQERKRKKLDKIMSLFDAESQIRSKDVQKLLFAKKRTVTNYLDQLEREQKITQVGEKGKGVLYVKKQ